MSALAVIVPVADGVAGHSSAAPEGQFEVAVIGDTPYGAAQIAGFPNDIAQINADPRVRVVMHLGDIKNGSSRCDDSYFALIRTDFDMFADPLIYTPGDNEWTDCYRTNNGGYLPTERLAKLRSVFFDSPGRTLGERAQAVEAQAAPFVENVSWVRSGTVFGTLNVPGSNNDLVPWFGAASPGAEQMEEYDTRLVADLAWIDRIFDRAQEEAAAGVVIGMQADMWDADAAADGETHGFDPIVAKLAERASAFGGPVLLLEGDSHRFTVDHPLAAGSPLHGVTTAAPNLTRIVVQGSTVTPRQWLRLRIDHTNPALFSWENVPFGG